MTDFKLNSAYRLENLNFTNFTVDFKGIIDYIFVSEDLQP
jgi:mRNA deadenylase 3'-5' endonuclease subunit Ccr4